jgi:CRP/FNR family transcriptional regulator, global nitrogen regulator
MDVDPSLPEYTKLQERECRELLQLLDQMGIATAERDYGPGDAVYREGEYGDALYVLTSGVLKLFRPYSGSKEATLRLLKPWDIFGHLAFAGEARQRAYAEAVTECRVTKVPKVFVERAIRQEPRVAFKLMTLLELRLVQYEELVKCLLPRETEVRLANLLPILAQKFGERSDGHVTIELRLTHQDLAAMVASTRESVTKVLNDMRSRDLIEVSSGRITLKDSRALARLSRP